MSASPKNEQWKKSIIHNWDMWYVTSLNIYQYVLYRKSALMEKTLKTFTKLHSKRELSVLKVCQKVSLIRGTAFWADFLSNALLHRRASLFQLDSNLTVSILLFWAKKRQKKLLFFIVRTKTASLLVGQAIKFNFLAPCSVSTSTTWPQKL